MKKGIIVFFIVVSLFSVSVVSASADSIVYFSDGSKPEFYMDISSTTSVDNVGWNGLCDLASYYAGHGIPCAIQIVTFAGGSYFALQVTGTVQYRLGDVSSTYQTVPGRYFGSVNGPWVARVNADTLLSSIQFSVSELIQSDGIFDNILSTMYSLDDKVAALSTKLDTLFTSTFVKLDSDGTRYTIADLLYNIWVELKPRYYGSASFFDVLEGYLAKIQDSLENIAEYTSSISDGAEVTINGSFNDSGIVSELESIYELLYLFRDEFVDHDNSVVNAICRNLTGSLSNTVSGIWEFTNRIAAKMDTLAGGSDLTGVTTRLDTIIGKLGTSSGSDLTTLESTAASIESTLSIINDKLDNTATKIENTTVNITNNNSAYNVFYVTDEDGNEHSITSVAGDSLSAGGKLLNFLYKLVVDGALSGVDGAVDGLGDFFFGSNPSGLGEGVSVWD